MKVLFIGNSHTYFNDMPVLFADFCKELTGEQTEVTMLAYSGRMLYWHAKEYFAIRFALLYGNYDYCVIQQMGHPFPGLQMTEQDAAFIISLCRRVGTKPVFYMTWAKKDEPEQIGEIAYAYHKLSETYGTLLAPIGELFETLRKSHPEIELYWQDGSHASTNATYLIAATFASLLTQTSNLDALPDRTVDFDAQIDADQPHAQEDPKRLCRGMDPKTASVLRETVRSSIWGI